MAFVSMVRFTSMKCILSSYSLFKDAPKILTADLVKNVMNPQIHVENHVEKKRTVKDPNRLVTYILAFVSMVRYT